MDGVYFLLAIIGVAIVVLWAFRNDRVRPDGATSGLLAMRDEGDDTHPQKKKAGRVRHAASLRRNIRARSSE
jgi:hypothetical protein